MNRNEMHNMVMGAPIPHSLPIGHLTLGLAQGGLVNPMLSRALGAVVEKRPELVHQGLRLTTGGKVPTVLGRPKKEMLVLMPTKGVDHVPAMLQVGEIVIPKKHANRVARLLKREHIKLPNL